MTTEEEVKEETTIWIFHFGETDAMQKEIEDWISKARDDGKNYKQCSDLSDVKQNDILYVSCHSAAEYDPESQESTSYLHYARDDEESRNDLDSMSNFTENSRRKRKIFVELEKIGLIHYKYYNGEIWVDAKISEEKDWEYAKSFPKSSDLDCFKEVKDEILEILVGRDHAQGTYYDINEFADYLIKHKLTAELKDLRIFACCSDKIAKKLAEELKERNFSNIEVTGYKEGVVAKGPGFGYYVSVGLPFADTTKTADIEKALLLKYGPCYKPTANLELLIRQHQKSTETARKYPYAEVDDSPNVIRYVPLSKQKKRTKLWEPST
jgi:hypothetical protein